LSFFIGNDVGEWFKCDIKYPIIKQYCVYWNYKKTIITDDKLIIVNSTIETSCVSRNLFFLGGGGAEPLITTKLLCIIVLSIKIDIAFNIS